MIAETDSLEVIEEPKSNTRRSVIQSPYWTYQGSSSPSCSRIRRLASGVPSWPSIALTGPPGIARSPKNTDVATSHMMNSAWATRLAMYRRMVAYSLTVTRSNGRMNGMCVNPLTRSV